MEGTIWKYSPTRGVSSKDVHPMVPHDHVVVTVKIPHFQSPSCHWPWKGEWLAWRRVTWSILRSSACPSSGGENPKEMCCLIGNGLDEDPSLFKPARAQDVVWKIIGHARTDPTVLQYSNVYNYCGPFSRAVSQLDS